MEESEARTKKLEELRAEYNNKTYADLIGDSDGFYKWLSKKNSQDVDRNKIKQFLDSIKLDSVIELESLNTKEKEIAKEIGDVLYYIAALCSDLDISMETVAQMNKEKLWSRFERGTLHGSGDNR